MQNTKEMAKANDYKEMAKANDEKIVRLAEKNDVDVEVLDTFECPWGEVDLVLLTHPDIGDNEAMIRMENLYITNCPKDVDEIDMELIYAAIRCYDEVLQTYGTVTFNYPTIVQDMEECLESCCY